MHTYAATAPERRRMCRLALRSRDQTMRRLWPCSIVLGNVHVRKTGSVPRKNATHGRSVDEKEQDSNVCLGRRPPSALNGDRKSDTASASLAIISVPPLSLPGDWSGGTPAKRRGSTGAKSMGSRPSSAVTSVQAPVPIRYCEIPVAIRACTFPTR
jgi:hypothetical protein